MAARQQLPLILVRGNTTVRITSCRLEGVGGRRSQMTGTESPKKGYAGSPPSTLPESKRVLHVNKFLYRRGGAEGYMLDLAQLQAGAGHCVEFFGMAHPENDDARYEAMFPAEVQLDPPPPTSVGKLRAAMRMVHSTSAQRGISQVVDLFQPDVVHMHNVYHQLSPSVLRPFRGTATPVVMTLHDYKLACPTYQFLDNGSLCEACLDGRYRHAIERRCNRGSLMSSAMSAFESRVHKTLDSYGRVDRLLCPSRFLAGKMAEAGVYPERLVHLPNFVDTEEIASAERAGSGLVFAGRMANEKGVDILIKAMSHLSANTSLRIAGEGPDRPALEKLARQTGDGRIRFLGRLSKERLHDEIRDAALVVVPSRWYENQPMVVLESFACGRAVVASDLGGLPELVRPGETGALVPAGDPAALAAAIQTLLSSPARLEVMGRAARAVVEREHSPGGHLERLHSIYEQAAGARASSAVAR